MHAERDWLRSHVFPELQERLRQRFHHLETIDLRWGVESASERDEQAREKLVLEVCLNEIVRSRPFLIALLGDRYGWQPPAERMRAAAKEAGFGADVAGKSVTELEILLGVLDSPDQRRRSWFYLREPLPYDEMPRELAARYSERHSSAPGCATAADRLDALKRRIEKELPERTRHYRAEWDPKRGVVGLQAWGDQVRDDLWSDLEAETEAFLRDAPTTWQGQDRWALGEFVEDRARGFVGRETITAELVELALSPAADEGEWGACVTGAAGAGKSALFAHLHRKLERPEVLLLAHAAGISVQSASVDRMLRRWAGELASSVGENDPLDDAAKPEDIEREFGRLLGLTSARRRVVVLIDALNQFEASTRGLHLTWLPKLWPPSARLIATAIPGAPSEALCGRSRVRELPLSEIDEREATAIVRGICQNYHRELNQRVVDALLAKRRAAGRLAHGSPLWLELAVEELNLLDADDFERADAEFADVPPGAERMVRLLLRAVAALPADVAGAYGALSTARTSSSASPVARAPRVDRAQPRRLARVGPARPDAAPLRSDLGGPRLRRPAAHPPRPRRPARQPRPVGLHARAAARGGRAAHGARRRRSARAARGDRRSPARPLPRGSPARERDARAPDGLGGSDASGRVLRERVDRRRADRRHSRLGRSPGTTALGIGRIDPAGAPAGSDFPAC
jgi:hypothetical protein